MSTFTDSIEYQLKGFGSLAPGVASCCPVCVSSSGMEEDELKDTCENGDYPDEGGFSWQSCESCGSNLGGDRFAAHAWQTTEEPTKDIVTHFDICVDCLMFHANGDEPPAPDDEEN